jgi:PAS domain S-box-containing protein
MGRVCRATDWAATPLGPVEAWPQCLRTAAGMVVGTGFPAIVLWGPDLIQIYNDGYIPVHGTKHPWALGRATREVWPEVWELNAPLFERARRGETVVLREAPYSLGRRGPGEPPDDVLVDLSFSPVMDEAGEVGGVLVLLVDTTASAEVRQLQAEENRLLEAEREGRSLRESLLDAMSDGFAAFDEQWRYTYVNRQAEILLGHSGAELLGRDVWEVFPEARSGPAYISAVAAMREQRRVEYEYFLPALGKWIRASNYPIPGGVAAVFRDVSADRERVEERERLLASERAARAEAEAANRAKSEFLASMSHELRTPLNAIGGYVDLLDLGIHGPLAPEQRAALARVTANQRHLLTLISDILAFARLEAGKIEFDLCSLAACDLLSSVERLIAPLAQSKGIALSIPECDSSIRLVADEERVRQILLNLVGNAIKFTAAGGWVALTCNTDDAEVVLRVQDNGHGIEREKQEQIFDAFIQVDRRLNHPQEGVGLGLAISRELAQAMGGTLTVDSAPGAGSTFTLRLRRLAPVPGR